MILSFKIYEEKKNRRKWFVGRMKNGREIKIKSKENRTDMKSGRKVNRT